uniref:Uncharacterized protein n=1 Tax=Romanomermis culicivorax TaxID=13658 RepID=A0A915I3Y8_ROMCU
MENGSIFKIQIHHGLWRICVETWYNKKLAFWKPRSHYEFNNEPNFSCFVRFWREAKFKTRIFPLIDQLIDFYNRNLIFWEIVVLVVLFTVAVLNLIVSITFLPMFKNYPLVLAALQLIACGMTIGVLVTFTTYHSTKRFLKNQSTLMTTLMQQTYDYGHSYWLTVASTVCQFCTFVILLCYGIVVARRRHLYDRVVLQQN